MKSNTTYNNALIVSAFKEDKELASKRVIFHGKARFSIFNEN